MQHLNLPSRIVMFSICSSIEYDIKKHILNCTSEIEFDKDMIEKVKERINKKIQIEQEMNQGGYSNENSKDFFKFNRQSKIIRKRHHKI